MLPTSGLRRAAVPLASRAQLSQRRFGGSLHKNKHVENYSNWRGDSEKRFKFDGEFFRSTVAWGVLPFALYYVVAADERRNRDATNGLPDSFRHNTSTRSITATTTPEDAAVAAFYARVVRRVCDDFREHDPSANAAVASLLAEKWRQRIACYTGVTVAESEPEADATPDTAPPAEAVAGGGERPSPSAPPTTHHIAAAGPGSRRPQSIFAAMLGTKRGISQVDGAQDDESGSDDEQEEKAKHAAPSSPPVEICDDDESAESNTGSTASSAPLTTPSSEVAAVLNPVWGFAVSEFPLQLSAEHSKFEYRQRRRDFHGKLSAIILTLTRPLRPSENVCAGHLLWLDDERAFPNESKGGTVEVVGASSANSESIVVKLPNGSSVTATRQQAHRYYECIVKKGKVWFEVVRR